VLASSFCDNLTHCTETDIDEYFTAIPGSTREAWNGWVEYAVAFVTPPHAKLQQGARAAGE
jgi:hypothetical protein